MKKRKLIIIALLLLAILASMLCSACSAKFTCDFCGQKCSGKQYDLTSWGRGYVCKECYNILWGRAGEN